MKIKPLLIFLLITLIFVNVYAAADIAGKSGLKRPIKYNMPQTPDDLTLDLSSVSEEDRMNVIWEVYSDRGENSTYVSPDSNEVFQKLNFLESFFVYEEQGDFIHIVKDQFITKQVFSDSVIDYGWVEKNKMLLWNHDLVTNQSKINRKAMILNTVEQLKDKGNDDKPDIVRFRKNPQTESVTTGEESQLFQFFYIYKISEDGQYVLLGKNSFYGPTSVHSVIKGWAPRNRSIFWFNRVAIEPNWEDDAVTERQEGDIVSFFSSKDDAMFYKIGEDIDPKNVIWNNDPLSKQRLIGEWRRFPVLRDDPTDSDILNTGVMGDIYTKEGELLIRENKKVAEMKRKIDNQITKKRNIKIVFVVDGTKSMGSVFKAVSNGIRAATENLNLEYRGKYGENAIDFAGVIYRDYSESRARRFRTRGFNSTQGFESFFNPAEARDVNNKTHSEAMYLGLETALLSLGLDKNQTNVLILIGDAGNHYPDEEERTADKIAMLLSENYCHFIAIQANHRKKKKAYDDFIYQNKVIAMSAAKKYRQILSQKYQDVFDLSELQWNESGERFDLEQSPLGMKVIGLEENSTMSEVEIQKEIEQFIKGVDASNDSLIMKLNSIVSGAGFHENGEVTEYASEKSSDFYTLPFAEGIWAVFQQSGLTLDELSTLKVDKYQVYTPGYTTMQIEGQSMPLFQRVLLMDATELGDLERCIRRLRSASTGSQRRNALYTTWLEILKEYLGESKSEEDMKELSLEDINMKLWELPGTKSILGNIKLKDIYDEHKFTDAQLNRYIDSILEKHHRIQNIFFSHSYKYGFRSNERPYYWIEEDLLP